MDLAAARVIAYVDWGASRTHVYCDGVLTVVLAPDAAELVQLVFDVLQQAGATQVFTDRSGIGYVMTEMLHGKGVVTERLDVRSARRAVRA